MSFNSSGLFAAAEGTTTNSSAGSFYGIPVHPGEDASAKEEDDWWRVTESVVGLTDAAYYIVKAEPPRLSHLESKDLTGYVELTVPAVSDANYLKTLEYNRKVKTAVAECANVIPQGKQSGKLGVLF